jgi:UTP--glucose-1-phosphate uridylyltransferase
MVEARRIRKAVFPVGGLGTRFLPATKTLAKEMLPVVDKPLVQYAFEEARDAGIEQFIFVMGRNKNAISNHFDHAYELQSVLNEQQKLEELRETVQWLPDAGSIMFIRQQQPLGLGHAVWCARHLVGDEPFAVLLADDLVLSDQPCLKQMLEGYAGGHRVAVQEVPPEQTNRYGILDVAREEGRLVYARGVVEKPLPAEAPSRMAVIGRYILEPTVFEHLSRQQRGAGGEIQLTDAIQHSIPQSPLTGYRFDGRRFDCGSKEGFLAANLAFALNRDDLREKARELLAEFYQREFPTAKS